MQFEDNYPLSKLTTLQIGGPAKKFVSVSSEKELIETLKFAKKQNMAYLVIGSGGNLLVSDEGFDGLIIKNQISVIDGDGSSIRVKSGTLLKNLVEYSIQKGLAGLQNLSGIPGTVGGAIYGNAGAYGQSISDHIVNVVLINSSVTKEACHFNYRDSIFKKTHEIILEVTFQLEPGDPETLKKEAEEVLSKRQVKYPPGIKCPGSFFKNLIVSELPPDVLKNIAPEKIVFGKIPAGALLEEVGAKGQSVNGIEISPNHANLFINKDGGTAKAFYTLAKTYALKVKEKFGIRLEPEVQLINLPPLI